jgi:hypothetical protein
MSLRRNRQRACDTSKLAEMRLMTFALLVFSACGGSGSDPHEVGTCEGWTDNQGNPFVGMCEAACQMPTATTGRTCDTLVRLNCAAFDFDGVDGCCVADATTIRFYECQ